MRASDEEVGKSVSLGEEKRERGRRRKRLTLGRNEVCREEMKNGEENREN